MDLSIKNLLPVFYKKAPQNSRDNEFFKQLFAQLGFQVDLSPYEIKEYIQQGYLINPHVYTVINKIIRPASAVPCYVYKIKQDSKSKANFKRYQTAIKSNNIEEAEYLKQKSTEIISYPEIDKVLENPNDFQSFQEWSEEGMAFHLLTGEEFIYGMMNKGSGTRTALFNMPPQVIKIKTGNYREPVKGYEIDFFGFNSDMIDIKDVLHIKMTNPNYSEGFQFLRGLSPLAPLCRTVRKSNDTQVAQMKLLQNGHPIGILSNRAERAFNDEEANNLKSKFRQKFQGAHNLGEILLTSLNLQWTSMGLNTTDLQLLDSDKLDLKTIARVYEVPLQLISDDASTYNNIKEARKEVWMTARLPLIKRRISALNRWLIPEDKRKDTYIDFDISSIEDLRLDDDLLVKRLAMEIQNAMLSPNEAREIRGREAHAMPEADKLYLGNFKPIDTNGTSTPKQGV